jgi:small subunit ribosomal protein S18
MRTMKSPREAREDGKGTLGTDRRSPFRRKACRLCADRVEGLDYRETVRLVKFISERGKILPRRISGNCTRHQRQLARAIKRARAIALLPYLAD